MQQQLWCDGSQIGDSIFPPQHISIAVRSMMHPCLINAEFCASARRKSAIPTFPREPIQEIGYTLLTLLADGD